MKRTNSLLLVISFLFILISIFYLIRWPNTSQNFYQEPMLVVFIFTIFPLFTFIISFISFFLFAKHYISNYINGFANEMIESYTDEISDPIENNL